MDGIAARGFNGEYSPACNMYGLIRLLEDLDISLAEVTALVRAIANHWVKVEAYPPRVSWRPLNSLCGVRRFRVGMRKVLVGIRCRSGGGHKVALKNLSQATARLKNRWNCWVCIHTYIHIYSSYIYTYTYGKIDRYRYIDR